MVHKFMHYAHNKDIKVYLSITIILCLESFTMNSNILEFPPECDSYVEDVSLKESAIYFIILSNMKCI